MAQEATQVKKRTTPSIKVRPIFLNEIEYKKLFNQGILRKGKRGYQAIDGEGNHFYIQDVLDELIYKIKTIEEEIAQLYKGLFHFSRRKSLFQIAGRIMMLEYLFTNLVVLFERYGEEGHFLSIQEIEEQIEEWENTESFLTFLMEGEGLLGFTKKWMTGVKDD